MQATGSTHMGMRWRWCRRLAALLLLASCTVGPRRAYVPTPALPRLSPDKLREQALALLHIECPRLLGSHRTAFGTTVLWIDLDASGAAALATLERSSGDAKIDDIFGALAAELMVHPTATPTTASGLTRRSLTMGYACAPSTADASVELGT